MSRVAWQHWANLDAGAFPCSTGARPTLTENPAARSRGRGSGSHRKEPTMTRRATRPPTRAGVRALAAAATAALLTALLPGYLAECRGGTQGQAVRSPSPATGRATTPTRSCSGCVSAGERDAARACPPGDRRRQRRPVLPGLARCGHGGLLRERGVRGACKRRPRAGRSPSTRWTSSTSSRRSCVSSPRSRPTTRPASSPAAASERSRAT